MFALVLRSAQQNTMFYQKNRTETRNMTKKYEQQFEPMPMGSVQEEIKRLRLNVILHSCIYYQMDVNIWDDITFDFKCKRLVDLLAKHPNVYSDRFDRYFEGWDGSSGFHFPHRDPWVHGKAEMMVKRHETSLELAL